MIIYLRNLKTNMLIEEFRDFITRNDTIFIHGENKYAFVVNLNIESNPVYQLTIHTRKSKYCYLLNENTIT